VQSEKVQKPGKDIFKRDDRKCERKEGMKMKRKGNKENRYLSLSFFFLSRAGFNITYTSLL
jgi:hypothetical protein